MEEAAGSECKVFFGFGFGGLEGVGGGRKVVMGVVFAD